MPQEIAFDDLMARLKTGDQQAAAEVFGRFTHRLIALARSRLNKHLLQKMDPEDVLQSVYQSFFTRQARGEFELHNWDSLWGLLTIMTLRKCGKWVDRYYARSRNVDAEVPFQPSADASGEWEALASEPTPDQAAILAETLEHFMGSLTERERTVLGLELQGLSVPEISIRIGRSERTVQRLLESIKKQLEQLCLETVEP